MSELIILTNIFLFIIIIIIFIYYNHMNKICISKPETFIYSAKNNPTDINILIVGTTHGNEPVGYHAITDLMNLLNNNKLILKKGTLTLVPVVNYCGFKKNTRNIFFFNDINRQYYINTNSIINQSIIKLTETSDFILDFHEGWGFHKIDNSSIGSTITPNNILNSLDVAQLMKDAVNNTINEDKKKFIIRTDNTELIKNVNEYSIKTTVSGTLASFLEKQSKQYILIETSGQNMIQPLDLRVNQAIIFINELLKYYNMI